MLHIGITSTKLKNTEKPPKAKTEKPQQKRKAKQVIKVMTLKSNSRHLISVPCSHPYSLNAKPKRDTPKYQNAAAPGREKSQQQLL
jgi:hypothetical protein